MKSIIVVISLASMILAGCSNVSAPYIITEDRVDQKMSGNRGYLMGTPPPVPEAEGVPKRTLIGIDVEIPLLPGEKGYKPAYKGKVIREEDIKMEQKKVK